MPTLVALTLAFGSAGCLRTRAQIREGDQPAVSPSSAGGAVQAQIEDVEPKGQYVIEEIKGEIVKLTGRVEDLERASKATETPDHAKAQETIKRLETRIQELEVAQADLIEQFRKIQNSAPAVENTELLQNAKKQIETGNLDSAIESLSSYLKNPKAKGAEEATFLRAEALFQQKQYKRAIADYAVFQEKYTRSKRLPSALLKIGMSFLALNSKDDANAFFQELIEKFPKSPEAKKARTQITGKAQ